MENEYNASSLYDDIPGCIMILGWDAAIQDFKVYVPGVPNDFFIENGYGYLVAVDNDTTLNLAGLPVESVNITLYNGWNMLGWYHEQPTTASSIHHSIPGCQIVLTWNATIQNFDSYIPGAPSDPIIQQGDGYLIAVGNKR